MEYWTAGDEEYTRGKQTLNKWVPEKLGDKDHPFTDENVQMMIEHVRNQLNYAHTLKEDIEK